MRVRVLVMGFAILLLSIAAPATAATVTLSSLFRQGEGGLGDTGPITTVCSDSTMTETLADSCSGSLTLAPGQVGYFEGMSEAVASSFGDVVLGSYATLDAWRENTGFFGNLPRYYASSTTTAAIQDTISILGTGTVTSGYLQLVFDVDGSVQQFDDPFTGDGFDPVTAGTFVQATAFAWVSANSMTTSLLRGDTTVTLTVPFTFGEAESLTLSLLAHASASILLGEGYRVTTDFLNTAVLTNSFVLDSNRVLLPGAYLESANGFTYPGLSAPQPVPEPATLLLIGTGLLALRRRRG